MSSFNENNLVHVTEYTRRRFGRTEHVHQHWRNYPRS